MGRRNGRIRKEHTAKTESSRLVKEKAIDIQVSILVVLTIQISFMKALQVLI